MEISLPLGFRDEPNLNGYYYPKELFEKSIQKRMQIPAKIPVHIGLEEDAPVVGQVNYIDLDNLEARVEVNDEISKILSDKFCLGYRIVADSEKNENGVLVVQEPIIFEAFGIIPKCTLAYKQDKEQ